MRMKCANDFLPLVERLNEAIAAAEAILIGAGAGLSTSAGFTYSGERFEKYFSDFGAKYGFTDMYSGGFYPFKTLEEFWAYWSRYIMINRYTDAPKSVYENLRNLADGKNYFVLTTNVDHCFQKAGFDKTHLFYTQGDYGLWQCSVPCHDKTYDNEDTVRKMVETQKDMRIPSDLIPYCPRCGKPMSMNLRSDSTFVEDEGWHRAAERYNKFIAAHKNEKILFLELGVGSNTPGIIKYPFWHMCADNPRSLYACINYGEAVSSDEIRERSICIDCDIVSVLSMLEKMQ